MAPNHGLKYPKCVLTQKGWHLLIYEAFGAIWMHKKTIFSENANQSKTRFQEKKYSHASTDHQVQFLNGFAIFHTPQGTQGVWKIAKKSNHIEKFCCGSVRKLPYFFQKIRYFFQKIVKNTKKIIIYFFLLEKYPSVPKLSYMF